MQYGKFAAIKKKNNNLAFLANGDVTQVASPALKADQLSIGSASEMAIALTDIFGTASLFLYMQTIKLYNDAVQSTKRSLDLQIV